MDGLRNVLPGLLARSIAGRDTWVLGQRGRRPLVEPARVLRLDHYDWRGRARRPLVHGIECVASGAVAIFRYAPGRVKRGISQSP